MMWFLSFAKPTANWLGWCVSLASVNCQKRSQLTICCIKNFPSQDACAPALTSGAWSTVNWALRSRCSVNRDQAHPLAASSKKSSKSHRIPGHPCLCRRVGRWTFKNALIPHDCFFLILLQEIYWENYCWTLKSQVLRPSVFLLSLKPLFFGK